MVGLQGFELEALTRRDRSEEKGESRAEILSERSESKDLTQSWWACRDLNPEPTDYESAALTVELQARNSILTFQALTDHLATTS